MVGGISGAGAYSGSYYDNLRYMPIGSTRAASEAAETGGLTGVEKSGECQTCKNRKYVDGSDEGNVSFKAPGHIAPENSAAVVSSHENMHVANARREGSKENAELISASVRLKTSTCPECGKAYVAGGLTSTTIKYSEKNPYEQKRKFEEAMSLRGNNVDIAV